jgi:hypothetical protein
LIRENRFEAKRIRLLGVATPLFMEDSWALWLLYSMKPLLAPVAHPTLHWRCNVYYKALLAKYGSSLSEHIMGPIIICFLLLGHAVMYLDKPMS